MKLFKGIVLAAAILVCGANGYTQSLPPSASFGASGATGAGNDTTAYHPTTPQNGTLSLGNGGTGSSTASGARTNLSAAVSGANGDITSLTGLTTKLPPSEGGVGAMTSAPFWLRFLGDGSEGAGNCSGNLSGEHWYTTFTVANGNTCTVNLTDTPLIIRATGACTIAGTINARGTDGGNNVSSPWGGGAGGGAGTGAGGTGGAFILDGVTLGAGGAGGLAGGNAGGNGYVSSAVRATNQLVVALGLGILRGGANGGSGGSSGPPGSNGGNNVILVCDSINFTGAISTVGKDGGTSTGNNVGAGAPGNGGAVIMSTRSYVANSGTITTTGGAQGTCGGFTGCGLSGTSVAGPQFALTVQ